MQLISLEQLGDNPSKMALGKARRHNLELILAAIPHSTDDEVRILLDKKGIDKKVLSKKIGLNVKPVNLRQTFADEIKDAEDLIVARKLIAARDTFNSEAGTENAKLFIAWIDEKLSKKEEFLWPITHKNMLYRTAIWALYSEQELDDVERTPTLFSRNRAVGNKLKSIDLKLANNELATESYASATSLDEMQDSMTNRKVLSLNQKVKTLTEQLAAERKEKYNLAKELKNLKEANEGLLSGDIASVKFAGVH
jgi:hypothetical protein